MRTAIDTNILSVLWSGTGSAMAISEALARAKTEGGLVVCGPVYSELMAHPTASGAFVNSFLSKTNIEIDFLLSEPVWRLAGQRFGDYARRRSNGDKHAPRRLLVDLLIGAHAALSADRMMTLDLRRYTIDYPDLVILQEG